MLSTLIPWLEYQIEDYRLALVDCDPSFRDRLEAALAAYKHVLNQCNHWASIEAAVKAFHNSSEG